jgi:ribosomal-protein-alanine N-acetyltransferase
LVSPINIPEVVPMPVLKTKRLRLVPMTTEQLGELLAQPQPDPHFAAALREMHDACLAHPDDRLWYTNWQIYLRTDGTCIGSLCFKGGPKSGAVELGYGIDAPYRNKGYATEAVKAAMNWAFYRQDAYFVLAETEKENAASVRVLEKNGFKPAGSGLEGPRWAAERPLANYVSVYLSIGLCMGIALGNALDSLALGTGLGLSLGAALGLVFDASERKRRKRYKKELNLPK